MPGRGRVAPTVLDFGIADALLGDNPITLDSLCFGTGSGSLAVHSEASKKFADTHPLGVESEDEEKKLRGEDADNTVIFNGEMILTDDTGRELLPSYPDGVSGGAVAYTVPAQKRPKHHLYPRVPQRCVRIRGSHRDRGRNAAGLLKLQPAMRAATPCRTLPYRAGADVADDPLRLCAEY